MTYDTIIIGAGVSGLMAAIELAQSGSRCCVLEQGQIGQESSWAGGGILSPLSPWHYPDTVNLLAQWSQQRYPDYFEHLAHDTGIDPEWQACGYLILDENVSDTILHDWSTRFGQPYERLNQHNLRDQWPLLATESDRAIWLPKVGQVRNPRLLKSLAAKVTQLGISIMEHTTVTELLIEHDHVRGVVTAENTLHSKQILIATGAWSGIQLAKNVAFPPVRPIKGQMIQYQCAPGEITSITQHQGHYLIPRLDGKVLVGSTLEDCGYDKSVDKNVATSLSAVAESCYPFLQDKTVINHWAGLRPGNDRQTPFICAHPEISNLFFNTGHYRNGIVLGLASAHLVADLMLGRTPILPADHYGFDNITS